MTVSYDPARITPEELAQAISQDRFKATTRKQPATQDHAAGMQQIQAPIPEDAPASFSEPFQQARTAGRPIVVLFETEWCDACQRLRKETLGHPDIKAALAGIELVAVDLDQSCELGGWYGVVAVPHVAFIDRNGVIIDSIQDFEPPQPFLTRLRKLADT